MELICILVNFCGLAEYQPLVYSSLLTAAQRKKKKVYEVQKMVLDVRNP
jgi:hypothetical protein